MHYVQLIIVIAIVAASAATMAAIRLLSSRKEVPPTPQEEYVPRLGNIRVTHQAVSAWTADYGQLLYQSGRMFIYVDDIDVDDYIVTPTGQIYPLASRIVSDIVARSWCVSCGVNVAKCNCYEEVWITYKEVPLTTED